MTTRDLRLREQMAYFFRNRLLARVKEAAPGTRVTLTLWNTDGRITAAPMQQFTVSSKHCRERTFEIPGIHLDRAFQSDVYTRDVDEKSRARIEEIIADIVLALIGRDKKPS